jgi:hypothetical protein
MGYAKLTAGGSSKVIRITGGSLNPVQAINAPDMVQGDYNKRAWNYMGIETGGNFTGPLGEKTALTMTQYAWNRDNTVGDKLETANIQIDLYFYKSGNSQQGRTFENCQVQSYQLSITAGEVCNFTADFFGTTVSKSTPGTITPSSPTSGDLPCEKLITWDQCGLTGLPTGLSANIDEEIQGWSLTINNNLKRIQRVGQPDLFPVEILAGIRAVEGSITIYASDLNSALLTKYANSPYFGADSYAGYSADTPITLTFTAGTTVTINLKAYFDRTQINPTTDTQIYTANFQGLCNDDTNI